MDKAEEGDGPSKCSRKATLSFFFAIELLAFTTGLLALLSPSWQFVYLENGRTEHHHGLWLDCKRDYSNEYGKTREYYETLWHLQHQFAPLDQLFLTPFYCVYKFDYYIDTEDLFDHNYDENQLQGDANQHLFLGHKIAALAAFCVSLVASAAAILLCICAFCHRSFICAAAVLTSVAAFFAVIGISIFSIWANYQDNNIIKDDGEIYEQYFGWAFYTQIVATILYVIASMIGCLATSISHHKRKAKLVKIEVVDSDDTTLLADGSQPSFKRSFSAIYRVDSSALRQWEHDYMKKMRNNSSEQSVFKRASSMPNIKKGVRRPSRESSSSVAAQSSISNLHEEVNSNRTTITTFESPMLPPRSGSSTKLKSALKPPRPPPASSDDDVTYEYVPFDDRRTPVKTPSQSSYGIQSSIQLDSMVGSQPRSTKKPSILDQPVPAQSAMSTALNVYDQVYTPRPYADEQYLEPNSVKSRNSTSTLDDDASKYGVPLSKPLVGSTKSIDAIAASRSPMKSTLIDDVVRPSTAVPFKTYSVETSEEIYRQTRMRPSETSERPRPTVSKKPLILSRPEYAIDPSVFENENNQRRESIQSDSIRINIFEIPSASNKEHDFKRSITSLSGRVRERVHEFDRPDSTDLASMASPQTTTASPTGSEMLQRLERRNRLDRQLVASALPRRNFLPDEVDRSVGSSTMLENDVMSESPSDFYQQAAELRLNLFLAGDSNQKISVIDTSETTV